MFTLVILCITVFICVSYTCFGHFKYLSPHNYEVSGSAHSPEQKGGSEPNFTLSYFVALQVKEEDEDAVDGADENTTVMFSVWDKNPCLVSGCKQKQIDTVKY